jgi:molybdenum cofactor cytidylyltransferase
MMTNMNASIILAAGYSSRMGVFKALLPLGEETIADRIISLCLQNSLDTYLVTGWKGNELKSGIKHSNVIFVENPDYNKGMFSSVKMGVSHLKTGYQGFIIWPVDIPLISDATIKTILAAAALHPQKIIYPVFKKRRGHPPYIPTGIIPEILKQSCNIRLKDILEVHSKDALEIKVADQNILLDIDSPEDYQQALRRIHNSGVPSKEECDAILSDICLVSPEIRRHAIKVTEVACKIGNAVLKTGKVVDLDIIYSASLLHDIAKGRPKHDLTGGQILKDLGFEKTAEAMSTHSDLPEENQNVSLETKIVFLADKLVKGENMVSLDERYLVYNRLFEVTPEIDIKIQQRKMRAVKVKREIETLLGYPIENMFN